MNTRTASFTSSLLALSFSTLGLAACGQSNLATGNVQSSQLGQDLAITSVVAAAGTYVDNTCIDPAFTDGTKRMGQTWALPGGDPVVVLNDRNCQLTLNAFVVAAGGQNYNAALKNGPITLSKDMFMAQPVLASFNDGVSNHDFYLNAMLTPGNFSKDFQIDLIYSSSPDAATPASQAGQYEVVKFQASPDVVIASPSYDADFSGVSYKKDADLIVTTASGNIGLKAVAGGQAAEDYMAASGACPTDLAMLNAGYKASAAIGQSYAVSNIGLVANAQLPLTACLIARHCDSQMANICSYQMLQLTFK